MCRTDASRGSRTNRLISRIQLYRNYAPTSVGLVVCSLLFCAGTCFISTASAQEKYSLQVPDEAGGSTAEIDASGLRITEDRGAVTRYRRQPKWDSADGLWIGYESASAAQVIRWPASNSGPMQIGRIVGGTVNFNTSRMQVLQNGGVRPILPPTVPGNRIPGNAVPGAGLAANNAWQIKFNHGAVQTIEWSTRDDRLQNWYLSRSINDRVSIMPRPNPDPTTWMVIPAGGGIAGGGMVRLQQVAGGRLTGLTVDRGRELRLIDINQSADQLWQLTPSHFAAQSYVIESVSNPGWVLSALPGGNLVLAPVAGSSMQVWYASAVTQPIDYEPMWRTVSHEVRRNPALAPAVVNLQNNSQQALTVLIADRRTNALQKVRIDARSQRSATFERDPGATMVEVFELRTPTGVWDRKEFATPIPPTVLYDLSVYEDIIQSIAIDRTGTSPNAIEDINVHPKSVGWIALPPGAQLPERGDLDVLAQARAAGNPGAVRRLDPRTLEKPAAGTDPLQNILNDVTQPKTTVPPSKDL